MAYIQDSTQSFVISLTALLQGKGIIISTLVINYTSGIQYTWNLSTGAWTPKAPEAVEGDNIMVQPNIQNQGVVADIMWGKFVSPQVTVSGPLMEASVGVGNVFGPQWSFYMPPNNVSITITAGHVE